MRGGVSPSLSLFSSRDRKKSGGDSPMLNDKISFSLLSLFSSTNPIQSNLRAAAERAARREQERLRDEVRASTRETEERRQNVEISFFSFFRRSLVLSFLNLLLLLVLFSPLSPLYPHSHHPNRNPSPSKGSTTRPPPASKRRRQPWVQDPAFSARRPSCATSGSLPLCPKYRATPSSSSSPRRTRATSPGSL